MIQDNENQKDTDKHLLDKLSVGDVIKSVCTCANAETEKHSLVPVYCHNCDAYVQIDL